MSRSACLARLCLLTLILPAWCEERLYVRPGGDDRAAGTARAPVATLERAQALVRARIRAGARGRIDVLLAGGTYSLPAGLRFGPEDGGGEGLSVHYRAQNGDVARLVGGRRLEGWRPFRDHIVVTDLPAGVTATQLFEDGRRLTLARAPRRGYFGLVAGRTVDGRLAFTYNPADLQPADWDLTDAQVSLWPQHNWFNEIYDVRALEPTQHTLILEASPRTLLPGNRYFVQNVLALLDGPGQCRIASTEGRVYAWPSGATATADLVLSTAPALIRIEGSADRPVRNLHFEGLDLSIAERDVVDIQDARDCSLRFCRIENAGRTGVWIHGRAERITVYGNEIREHGQHGVSLQGLGMADPYVNHHHTIVNNHIHHCGRRIGHGYGIRISQSGDNRIEHNAIHDLPRYGISLKGSRYGTVAGKIAGMTWENRYDFMHGRNNRIAYNDIHHTNLDSQDTGAIESWGSGRDNRIDHNRIHDTGNEQFNLQSGIYLDDQADYWTVTNNLIYGVTGTARNQAIFAKGIGNRIENNLLVGNPACDVGIRSQEMAGEACRDHVYRRNLIVFEPGAKRVLGRFGAGVSNLHAPGTTLQWAITVAHSGTYRAWLRYAAANTPWNVTELDGRMRLRVTRSGGVVLENLPDTGAWDRYRWADTAGLALTAGDHVLTWENVQGGGINLDALVLCDDPAWRPEGVSLPEPAAGRACVVVQAETYVSRDGLPRDNTAYAFAFVNWSEDRVAVSDDNLFFKPDGDVAVQGSPADGSLEAWRALLGGRYDRHSLVADPGLADGVGRDFSLAPNSPARDLGFEAIDTTTIGLLDDFPARLRAGDGQGS